MSYNFLKGEMMLKESKEQWSQFTKQILHVWDIYGGFKSMAGSPLFQLSLLFSLFTVKYALAPLSWLVVIDVMPNILGFSLGAYAIWLSTGNEKFTEALGGSQDENKTSPLMDVSASFAYLIMFQFLSIFLAIVNNSWFGSTSEPTFFNTILWFFSWWVFLYALLLVVAALMRIFLVSFVLEKYLAAKRRKRDDS